MRTSLLLIPLATLALASPALTCPGEPSAPKAAKSDFVHRLTSQATERFHAGSAWAGTGAAVGGALLGSVTRFFGGDYQEGFETGAVLGGAAGFAAGVIYEDGNARDEMERHPENL